MIDRVRLISGTRGIMGVVGRAEEHTEQCSWAAHFQPD